MTYLGIGWSVETLDPNPRFKDEQVVELTKKFNAGNWTVTWDVPMLDNGRLAPPIKQQLTKLKPLMEETRRPPLPAAPTSTSTATARARARAGAVGKLVVTEETAGAFPASDSLPMIEAKRQRTQWFYNATWGLWSHYLGRSAGQGCIQTCINGTDDWQRRIDRFNVTKTAEQLVII